MINPEQEIHIAVSRKCNNNCIFCLDAGERYFKDIHPQDVERQLKQAKKLGKKRPSFESGEPTLNSHLNQFAKLAKHYGFDNVSCTTNGRRLSYFNYARSLLIDGINQFNVSIHGSNARVHDALTRTPGSFRQTLKGIRNLNLLKKRYHFTFFVTSTITNINLENFGGLIKLLSKFNLDRISFNIIVPKGNALKFFNLLIPRYSVLAEIFKKEIVKTDVDTRKKIRLFGIVPCLMEGFIDTIGVKNLVFKYDSGNEQEHPFDCKRAKRDECRCCVYFSKCPGVPVYYISKYGWEEFKPI
jgi:cyclic pyranopterin phosphate synthase